MAKNYFFRTNESGKLTLVPNQTDESGNALEDLNVSASKSLRDKCPAGTVFVGDSLNKVTRSSSASYYYTTTNFRRLTPDCGEEILNSYKELSGKTDEEITKESSIKLIETIMGDETLKAPTSKEDGFFVTNDNWTLLVRNIKKHINTMIIGQTGCGKTTIVKRLCDKLGLKLYVFDMGSVIDPISSLLGVHRLEDGKSVFDYAEFTKAIQEPGTVILLDELSRASMAAENILFPCLDDRRKLTIEVAGSKDVREIKVNPDVTFIATANIGTEYTGTNSMDKALINRFFPLELNDIPKKEEIDVLVTRCGISSEDSSMIVKVANNIRALFGKDEISSSISIRETLQVAELVADGWNLGKAMEMIFLPIYEGTKSDGERSTVYKTISSY